MGFICLLGEKLSGHVCNMCGSTEDAWRLFEKMPSGDMVTWNVVGFGTCEMWARLKLSGIILTNATGRVCGKTLCHLFSKCDSHCLNIKRSEVIKAHLPQLFFSWPEPLP